MNRKRSRGGIRPRKGVTLIELIVASTILMLGLLSIVGVSASIARALGEARTENLAAIAAQSRFEELAGKSSTCTTAGQGSVVEVTSRGITERYLVTDAGNNTVLLSDSLSWKTRRNITRQANFQTLLPCRTGA
jgi:type II secretory pathway pseudopilin PulG